MSKLKIINKYPHLGHRARLRKKFLQSGFEGFLDYEIVELLLTLGTPMKDCKQQAKAAIKKFKNLRGVLDASVEDLQSVKGIGPANVFGIKLFQAMSEKYAKEKIPKKITFRTPKEICEYMIEKIGKEKKEHFVILLLDAKNNLIKDINISTGTLTSSLVHPREVFEPAIRNSAASIILVHNHPSGDSEPSEEDIQITHRLLSSADLLGIKIMDHVIVTADSYASMREKRLF